MGHIPWTSVPKQKHRMLRTGPRAFIGIMANIQIQWIGKCICVCVCVCVCMCVFVCDFPVISSLLFTCSKHNAPSPDLSPGSSTSSCSSDGISVNSPQQFTNRVGTHPLSGSPHSHTSNSSGIATTSHMAFTAQPGGQVAPPPGLVTAALISSRKLPFQSATDSMSLFSSANGFPANRNPKPVHNSLQSPGMWVVYVCRSVSSL